MPKITPLNSHKLIKALQKAGFKTIRQKGSHVIMIDERKIRIAIKFTPEKMS